MKTNSLPLVPYLRQSRAKERTISIDEQRRDVQQWAEGAGVKLAEEIVEQNVSGSKPWRERGIGDAVAACERGEASGIIVAWQDRLSRENGLATAEVWEALEAADARLVSVGDSMDTASGDHEMLFTIRAAIAREQWKRHRANWEKAQRNAAERGVACGRANIGYRKANRGEPFTINESEAAKVRQAFELRAAGVAISRIAVDLGWSHSTTRQVLANPVYLGTLTRGGVQVENAHPAIVARDVFDAVQASRTLRPIPAGVTTLEHALIGLACCAGCGRTLKVVRRKRANGSHVSAYYCKNAASVPCPERAYVHTDVLDVLVVDWFTVAIRTVPRMVDVVQAGLDLAEAQRDQRREEAELNAYVETAAALDAVLFRRGLEARQERVETAREATQHLAARSSRIPAGGSLAALWDGFDVNERRTVLAGFLGRVEVARGASTTPAGHVRLFWADGSPVMDDERETRIAAA